jgi:hypothetical protein
MKRRRLVGVLLGLCVLGGLALFMAFRSTGHGGIVSVPESSAPLHSSGGGVYVSSVDGASRKYDVAMVTVHNAAHRDVRVLAVSPRIIGRLVFDGASLQSAADNNPGEGVTDAPFPEKAGDTLAPITRTRHPLVHAGANETLIVGVHIPPGKSGGATLSVSVRYRAGGVVYQTTYKMPYVACAQSFDGGTCNVLLDRTRAFADAA